MNAALILTLLVGTGLDLPRWDAGALAPGSEAIAEVLVQGTGSLEVMSSCDCLSAELALGGENGAGSSEPARVNLRLRPGSRLGWHRADVQITQRAPDKTRIYRIPVTFELESLVPALDPELVFDYGRDDPPSARALEELAPVLTRLGLSHVVYASPGTRPVAVRERNGATATGVDAVRERVLARCADGIQADRANTGELLYFHDPATCSSAGAVRGEVVDAAVARHGLVLRDLPLDVPANLRLFCALTGEADRASVSTYAAWVGGKLFVGEPEIREILPRHLARAHGPRLLTARAATTAAADTTRALGAPTSAH